MPGIARKSIRFPSSLQCLPEWPADRVPVQEAARSLGLHKTTLGRWADEGCPCWQGRKLDSLWVQSGSTRYPRACRLLLRSEVEELRRRLLNPCRVHVDSEGSWVPDEGVPAIYPHASRRTRYRYRNRPCPQLGGLVLRAKRIPAPPGGNHRRKHVWAWHQEDLERFRAVRMGRAPLSKRPSMEEHVGLRGEVWLPALLASKVFVVKPATLSKTSCKELPRQFIPAHTGGRYDKVCVYPLNKLVELFTLRPLTKARLQALVPIGAEALFTSAAATETVLLPSGQGQGGAATERPPRHRGGGRQPDAAPGGAKRPGGRPRSAATAEVEEFCYELYHTPGLKMAAALRKAQVRFGTRAPKDESALRLYAKRYAKRKGLPSARPG